MAALSTIILGAATAAGIAGTALQYVGSQKQQAGQERAERIRRRQMELQASRDRRTAIRNAVIARAQATSNATAQGAGDNSGLQGGLAQITGQMNQNIQGINQGLSFGRQMFSANQTISSGQTYSSIGGAIQSFGDTLANGYERFSRVGQNAIA